MMRPPMMACAATAGITVIVMSCAALIAGGQEPRPAVFTARQAAAGRVAFVENCATCHMRDLSGNNDAPPLAGVNFASTWGARTTKDLLDYVSAAMPPGGPSLGVDTYASITAYILQSNGAVAGTQALGASTIVSIGRVTAASPTTPAARRP